MKKLALWMLALFMLLMTVLPAAALPVDELTAFAEHIPANADMAVVLRTDAAYFETLDGVVNSLLIDTGIAPAGSGLMASMDDSAGYVADGETFNSLYGDWLGGLSGVFSVNGTNAEGLSRYGSLNVNVYGVTDRDAAAEYVAKNIGDDAYEETDVDGMSLYVPTESAWRRIFLLTDTVIYEVDGGDPERIDAVVAFLTAGSTLAKSENFNASVAKLPGDDYNILVYINFEALLANVNAAEMDGELGAMGMGDMVNIENMLGAIGAQVWGFTVADGNNLIMDIAQVINDTDALHNITLGQFEKDPLDMSFARYVPADAALVMHDSGLGHGVTDTLDLIESLGEALDERFEPEVSRRGMDSPEVGALLVDDSVTFMKLAYKGLTGQTLEEGIGWMNGNYAVYARVVDYDNMGIGLDAGLIMENTDSAALEAFVAGQRNALNDLFLEYEETDNTIAVPWLSDLAVRMFPEAEAFASEIDVLLGWNDEVLVAGARPGVERVLSGVDGIDSDATFQAATPYILPDSQTIAYINFGQLTSTVDYLERVMEGYPPTIANVVEKLDSASISSSFVDDTLLIRMVFSLSN